MSSLFHSSGAKVLRYFATCTLIIGILAGFCMLFNKDLLIFGIVSIISSVLSYAIWCAIATVAEAAMVYLNEKGFHLSSEDEEE